MRNLKTYKTAIYTGVMLLLVSATACKRDFLEVTPTQQINAKEAFSSPAKIQAAMTGIYDLTTFSGYTNNMILSADVKGNDVMIVSGAANYNRFVAQYQFIETVNSADVAAWWEYSYKVVSNANQFVENIPASPISDALKTEYLAEARALRAYTYFWLVRWFAQPYSVNPDALGVPILRKPLGPNETSPSRDKVKDVYAFILEDLKYAETNLPTTGRTSIYRMSVPAIQGILARVYLTMGNWAEASRYAKLARAAKPLSTAAALLTGFNNPTSEWIYAINVRTDDNQGFLAVSSFYDPYDVGYSSFRVTDDFFNSFAANDERKKQFLVKSSPTAAASTGEYRRRGEGYLINKFDFTTTNANNQVLIRSSEMYLIEAEAEARLTNEAVAKQALLAVQQRAGVATTVSANTGNALIEEILTERNKELYGEGHKFFDLLRTNKGVNRTGSTVHWKIVNFPSGDNRLVSPIPQAELDANPVLKPQQNPGY
ncbi:RagB/SusD family nutrient uptake outer membrane protein [Pedobacter chinensis]|uniref:RagB/SusD family nutrient uptake outer membrane protein n=1 Tax=Pedobacter chinensis TaxID=2282421 RepID=A0A369Q1E0_9SPHI|nr:RagB/SusD family nutrient uptake outer membrane protein [Pedobacter chinensis]RDC56816.1 RagB/SusD family nutrient uptake outer membrane protein [Pedobacter chinensis]